MPRWPPAEPLNATSAACQKLLGEPSDLLAENHSARAPSREVYDGRSWISVPSRS